MTMDTQHEQDTTVKSFENPAEDDKEYDEIRPGLLEQ